MAPEPFAFSASWVLVREDIWISIAPLLMFLLRPRPRWIAFSSAPIGREERCHRT